VSDDNAPLAFGSSPAQECSTSSILEDLPNTLTGAGRAFEVVAGTDLLSDCHTLFRGHRTLVGLPEFVDGLGVTSQVLLATNKDDRQASAKVHDLGDPLLLNVIQTIRAVNCEANEDDMRVGIAQGPQPIIVLLTSCIPKGKLDVLSIYFDVRYIVLEDGGNVDLRESSLREHNQKAGLAASTITDDDELPSDLAHSASRYGGR